MMDVPTVCPNCNGKGCEDCLHLGFIAPVSQESLDRARLLFCQKLAERYPDHPWLKRKDANQ